MAGKEAKDSKDERTEKVTTGDRMVQMFYPLNAKGPQSMVLHGVGYFERGKLCDQLVPREVAEGIVERQKGPRIATAADLKKVEEAAAKSPAPEQTEDPAK